MLEEPEQPEAAAEMLLPLTENLPVSLMASDIAALVKLVTVTLGFVVLALLPEA